MCTHHITLLYRCTHNITLQFMCTHNITLQYRCTHNITLPSLPSTYHQQVPQRLAGGLAPSAALGHVILHLQHNTHRARGEGGRSSSWGLGRGQAHAPAHGMTLGLLLPTACLAEHAPPHGMTPGLILPAWVCMTRLAVRPSPGNTAW